MAMATLIATIEFPERSISVLMWANGDGFTALGTDFETEEELVQYLKRYGQAERARIYEPSLEGLSIVDALGCGYKVSEDGPGLYNR